jgi:sensor histidine kinase regulating citrate/malate metabolism
MFWMSLLSFKTTLLVLVVVVVVVVMLGTTIIIFPLVSFAYHGQEISILLDSAEFIPPSENGEENQV